MLNNIQIYHIKAEDPMITSISRQMQKFKKEFKCLVGLDYFFYYQPDLYIFGFSQ